MQNVFKANCEKISEETGIDVSFFPETDEQAPYEDDGNLHITLYGLRAVFDVGLGQSLSASTQNARTKRIMRALDLEITGREIA